MFRIYRQDERMEFDIEKCTMLLRIKQNELNNPIRKTSEYFVKSNKYLGILKAGTIKQIENKEKERNV